jgi:hypothetical protein
VEAFVDLQELVRAASDVAIFLGFLEELVMQDSGFGHGES